MTAAIKCVISPGVLKSETLTRTVPVSSSGTAVSQRRTVQTCPHSDILCCQRCPHILSVPSLHPEGNDAGLRPQIRQGKYLYTI